MKTIHTPSPKTWFGSVTIPRIAFISAIIAHACLRPTKAETPATYSWQPGYQLPGIAGAVTDIISFDDGRGLALYVSGGFSMAGTTPCQQIARWDGEWEAVGNGVGTTGGGINAIAFYNDGTGSKLCAAGSFSTIGGMDANRIACWDGVEWAALGAGTNSTIRALKAHDDGSGPSLFAAGDFIQAGGISANRVAKWNGSAWVALGSGVNGAVRTLSTCFGSLLCAGGSFSTAGGNPAYNVATWNGTAWTNPGNGMNGAVYKLLRGATSLFAGGSFTEASNRNEARGLAYTSTGGQWFGYGDGFSYMGIVYNLAEYDDGAGRKIYAVGNFISAGSPITTVNYITRYSGGTWAPMGSGADYPPTSMLVSTVGGNSALYVGGAFKRMDTIGAASIAKYTSGGWESLSSGNGVSWGYGGGGSGPAGGMAVFDDGSGPALFFAGIFASAGNAGCRNIARWDGVEWSPLGRGIRSGRCSGCSYFARAIVPHDDGSGPSLFVGGSFYGIGEITANNVAKWNGSEWIALSDGTYEGDGTNGSVYALATFDDGTGISLYAGGQFSTAGRVSAPKLARWDGTDWWAVGPAISGISPGPYVYALDTFDDGNGIALYVAGNFEAAGKVPTSNIARWDGFEWTALQEGTNGTIRTSTIFDDGQGEKLFVGGDFTQANNVPAGYVASWDGNQWAVLGQGLEKCLACPQFTATPVVRDLTVFDDGTGPALFAAGRFVITETGDVSSIAKWNGRHWSSTCYDVNGPVDVLAVYDDGNGPALYAGGSFDTAGGFPSFGFAKWGLDSRKRGDCNDNPGLDFQDWELLLAKLTGPDQGASTPCDCSDFDNDEHTDLRDVAYWSNAYSTSKIEVN